MKYFFGGAPLRSLGRLIPKLMLLVAVMTTVGATAPQAQAGSGKDVGFEFKVQVSPKSRKGAPQWKTMASYKHKSQAVRKAKQIREKYGQITFVRVKQRK